MDLRLGVGGIVDLGSVVPVAGFLGLRVLDLLGGQHVPVVLQGAGLHLLVVDPHLIRLVWIQDQRVQVGELVVLERGDRDGLKNQRGTFCHRGNSGKRYLALNVLLDEVVLALVVEDHVNLLGAVSTDVRPWRDRSHYEPPPGLRASSGPTGLTEHDVILRVPVHVALVQVRGEDLDVAASAVDLLLVLDGELDDQGLPLVTEGVKAGRHGVKAGILAGLDAWWRQRQDEFVS